MKTFTLRQASSYLFSVEQIQKFYIEFPHEAVDSRSGECMAGALEERNIFVFSDSVNRIRGGFALYPNMQQHSSYEEYVELGSNRLAPELQGFGLLILENYIRILSEITRRIENNLPVDQLIFHADTLSYLPGPAKKLRQLGFIEVPRTDERYYLHIKSLCEHKETIYFIMPLNRMRNHISLFAQGFLEILKKLNYRKDDSGDWIMLNHRVKDDPILIKLELDILASPSKFNLINELAHSKHLDIYFNDKQT